MNAVAANADPTAALVERASALVGEPLTLDRVLSAPERRNFLARVRGASGTYVLGRGTDPAGLASDGAGAHFLSGLPNARLKRNRCRFIPRFERKHR